MLCSALFYITLTELYMHVTIMIDDVSLMEVAAYGSSVHVVDFLHYCHTWIERTNNNQEHQKDPEHGGNPIDITQAPVTIDNVTSLHVASTHVERRHAATNFSSSYSSPHTMTQAPVTVDTVTIPHAASTHAGRRQTTHTETNCNTLPPNSNDVMVLISENLLPSEPT